MMVGKNPRPAAILGCCSIMLSKLCLHTACRFIEGALNDALYCVAI